MSVKEPPQSATAAALIAALVGLAALLAVGWIALASQFQAPAPLPADAPAEQFSAARAFEHVEAIAAEPHPVGTAAHARAREHIVRALEAQGLEPQVQEATTIHPTFGGKLLVTSVRNVLARLPGTNPGKAVLLVAHYDSAPSSRGAADDGAGVATLLETLRALGESAPLDNDVLFLFTDGEEVALSGAQAFVDEHPWAAEVGVVLNFEARGASGPSIMFRTQPGNGWLVRTLRAAAPAPVATSLSYDVFKLLPNDTDFTRFEAGGLAGMDFAFIGDHPRYHVVTDSPANLDLGSLQHHGSYALALTRHLGGLDLANPRAPDAVYFNLPGSLLVVYPVSWALPLVAAAGVLLVAVAILGVRRGRAKIGRILGGFAASLLTASSALLVLVFANQQIDQLDGDFLWLPYGVSYEIGSYAWGLILLGVAVAAVLGVLVVRGLGTENLVLGSALLWLVLAGASAVMLPGASYLFLWPLLAALAALGAELARSDAGPPGWGSLAIGLLPAAVVLILLLPLTILLIKALGLTAAPYLALLMALPVGLCAPLLARMTGRYRFWPGAASFAAALALLLPAALSTHSDADRPRTTSLFYGYDTVRGDAVWASIDTVSDERSASVLPNDALFEKMPRFAFWDLPFRSAPATPLTGLEAPLAELVGYSGDDGVVAGPDDPVPAATGSFKVHLRLRTLREAPLLLVGAESLAGVKAVVVDGTRRSYADAPRGGGAEPVWLFARWGPPEPVELTLELTDRQPVEIQLVDGTLGLPEADGLTPRPADSIPSSAPWWNETTLVRGTASF